MSMWGDDDAWSLIIPKRFRSKPAEDASGRSRSAPPTKQDRRVAKLITAETRRRSASIDPLRVDP